MITLYGGPTTNVRKVTIALEELELSYKAHHIRLDLKHQHQEWFLAMAPNHKIPLLDDSASATRVWESGAILTYLTEQYDTEGKILAKSGQHRYTALQGAFFQAAHIGPNLGRLNDQLTASEDDKIPAMADLFYAEAIRLSEVLNRMLADSRPYLAINYSIADIMHYPWMKAALDLQFPALIEKPLLVEWIDRIGARPAVQRGMRSFS
ncbi:MAG: glutathione S-transferase family protein [Pseudomonadales bacterium]